MESVVPNVIILALASVPEQAWVWARFVIIVWGIGAVIIAPFRAHYLFKETTLFIPSIMWRSFRFALGWPLYALFGGIYVLICGLYF